MQKPVPSILDFDQNDTTRGWHVIVDGKEVHVKKRLSLVREGYGRIDYGKSVLGYDTVSYADNGGVAVVPYFILDNELFIGFVEQPRPNQNSNNSEHYYVYNIPRGSLERKENFKTGAKRELTEETRINPNKTKYDLKRLSFQLNGDSAFFATDTSSKNGIEFFSVEIPCKEFEIYRHNVYKLMPAYLLPGSDIEEKIVRCLFFHWTKIFELTDMNSYVGVLLLRTSLEKK